MNFFKKELFLFNQLFRNHSVSLEHSIRKSISNQGKQTSFLCVSKKANQDNSMDFLNLFVCEPRALLNGKRIHKIILVKL